MAQLFLCGEGPTDFGKEGNFGSLALVVFKTLEYLADSKRMEYKMPKVKCLYHRDLQPARIKNGNFPIARKMIYGRKRHSSLREKAATFADRYVTSGNIGVFHSDVDFNSQSDGNECYDCAIADIKKGFALAKKADCCCALVTMPRMEAWLLHLVPENQLSPQDIERLPGNDSSPNAPKIALRRFGYVTDNCGNQRNKKKRLSFIIENYFDYSKMINLSAYKKFYDDFASLDWYTLI